MGNSNDREAVWRDLCADLDFDDMNTSADDRRGLHPKRRGKRPRKADAWRDRRLCGQVRQAVQMGLADCGDPLLQNLLVLSVEPTERASCLCVHVTRASSDGNAPGDESAQHTELIARLNAAGPRLRSEVARSIHRKKTPQLVFELHPAEAFNA